MSGFGFIRRPVLGLFLALLSVLAAGACIRVPLESLPEVALGERKGAYLRPPEAYLINSSPAQAPANLGEQYMLLFLPLTELQLPEGLEARGQFLAGSSLRELGFRVEELSPEQALRLDRRGACLPVIQLKLLSASVNAYDFLFFRLLSVRAEMDLEFYSSTGQGLSSKQRLAVTERQYKLMAHRPVLSAMFEEAIKRELKAAILKHYSSCQGRPVRELSAVVSRGSST